MKEPLALSREAQAVKPGKYRHFKGDIMEVVGIAVHSETLEEFAVYRHLTGDRAGEPYFWIRPVQMFLETVERDGQMKPRFAFIDEGNLS
ncbi:MAG: DUF1653 domain-containing protein [Patescibacteria group bacterium]|nr:DUF1653 domain-containing protein [Patescibacteria group bacterium]